MRGQKVRLLVVVVFLLLLAAGVLYQPAPSAQAQSNACLKAHYEGVDPFNDCVCNLHPYDCYAFCGVGGPEPCLDDPAQ
ncbi:MAG: hypothetical protein Kow00109_19720 [Acidobacteriota bacterium]